VVGYRQAILTFVYSILLYAGGRRLINKKHIIWTEKDESDAKAFVIGVKNGWIKTMNFNDISPAIHSMDEVKHE